eukprot:TRINITY_DN7243_c0_g1_i1.p1 TRINITY_DN7243_c0_g1~~TRINITY_DN7243_c0_g1_i1.p1  ORF type:complete len:626 (+),score=101.75 TRINITY_DN7243_c0_g1_i1:34-1911(+)
MPALRFYDLLKLHRSATPDAVRSAYRRSALETHPDKGGTSASFMQIVSAFEVLIDSAKRELYDSHLRKSCSTDGLRACDTGSSSSSSGLGSSSSSRTCTVSVPSAAACSSNPTSSASNSGIREAQGSDDVHGECGREAPKSTKATTATRRPTSSFRGSTCGSTPGFDLQQKDALLRELKTYGVAAEEDLQKRLGQFQAEELQAFELYVQNKIVSLSDSAPPKRRRKTKCAADAVGGKDLVCASNGSDFDGSSSEESDEVADNHSTHHIDFEWLPQLQDAKALAILDEENEADKVNAEGQMPIEDAARLESLDSTRNKCQESSTRKQSRGIVRAHKNCYRALVSVEHLKIETSTVPLERAIVDHIFLVQIRTAVQNRKREETFEDVVCRAIDRAVVEDPSLQGRLSFRLYFCVRRQDIWSMCVPLLRLPALLELRATVLRARDDGLPNESLFGLIRAAQATELQRRRELRAQREEAARLEKQRRVEERRAKRVAELNEKAETKSQIITLRGIRRQVRIAVKAVRCTAARVHKLVHAMLRKEGLDELPAGVHYKHADDEIQFYADISSVRGAVESCRGPMREHARAAIADLHAMNLAYEREGQLGSRRIADNLDIESATERFMLSLG